MRAAYDLLAPKRAANLNVNGDLLDKAKELGISLSATLEQVLAESLKRAQREQWLAENRQAMHACNEHVEAHGVFSDSLRAFCLMAQFDVCRNADPATKTAVPLLLDVQGDLIDDLGTRIVVPLCTLTAMKGKTLKTLMTVFAVGGKSRVMATPQLAGIARKQLGEKMGNLSAQRDAIMAALDFLTSGI